MKFSTIDWSIYDLSPIAMLIGVDEHSVKSIFDSEAGFHMVGGACSKSKSDVTERVAQMLFNYMDGEVNKRQAHGPNNTLLMSASIEQIRDVVNVVLDQMDVEWSSDKVKDLM